MRHNGYDYVVSSTKPRIQAKYYKCAERQVRYCRAILIERNDTYDLKKPHNHPPSGDNSVREFRRILKHRALTETSRLHNIYLEESRRHPEAAEQYPWPTAESFMRAVRRTAVPPVPSTLLDLGNVLENHLYGTQISCHDSRLCRATLDNGHGVSVVLYCEEQINEMLRYGLNEIHADGTFKILPATPSASQLFIIHGIIDNHSIPMYYAIMERRTRQNYDEVIGYFKNQVAPTLMPSLILTDYERGLQNSFSNMYPEASIKGCFFHYAQAVWKKMVSYGHLHLINANGDARRCLKMAMALPLLPADRMEEGLQIVREEAHEFPQLENFFNYIQRYWFQRVGPQVVSVHGLPRRTNNNLESFHSLARHRIGQINPPIWTFLNKLQNIVQDGHTTMGHILSGRRPTRVPRNTYVLQDQRIRGNQQSLQDSQITVAQFLRRCCYSVATMEADARNWVNAHPLNDDAQNHVESDDNEEEENPNPIPENPDPAIPHLPDPNPLPENPPDLNPNNIPQNPPHGEGAGDGGNATLCAICRENRPTHLYVPCGHLILCEACAEQVTQRNIGSCILCRTDAYQIIRVFF